jgi:hypothetical protein
LGISADTSWPLVPWVYLGESFPLRVRSKSIALGSATNWLWNFLLSFFAPRIAKEYVKLPDDIHYILTLSL